jgi:hypothetical protein
VTETEPIDFFIYDSAQALGLVLGPGSRENVGGQAHADIRTLLRHRAQRDRRPVGRHRRAPRACPPVFDTAVRNPYRFPPRWLNEGRGVPVGGLCRTAGTRPRAASRQELIPVALGGQSHRRGAHLLPMPSRCRRSTTSSAARAATRRQAGDGYADGLTDDEAFARATGSDSRRSMRPGRPGAAEPTRYGPQPAPAGRCPAGRDRRRAPGRATPAAATGSPASRPRHH